MLSREKKSNNLIQFIITVIAAGVIFPLLYLRQNFEVSILDSFKIELSQLSYCYSLLGIIFAITYLPSGWLADKFSCKKLIILSLSFTALIGAWFSFIPSYTSLIIIFCSWGLTTGLTFWSAHLKIVAMLAGKEQQGRFFGSLDGGRGLVEALLATLAVSIFAVVMSKTSQDFTQSLKAVIYIYIIAIVMIIPLVFIFLDEHDSKLDKNKTKDKHVLKKDLLEILRNKNIWLCTICIICGYQLFWATYSFSGYLQNHLGFGAVTVASITVAKLWMRPLGAISAGFIGDYFDTTKLLAILMVLASLALASLPFTSAFGLSVVLSIVLIIGLLTYGVRGIYWATLEKCSVDNKTKGLAIGFISMIAYLPDIYLPIYRSWLLTIFSESAGYSTYYVSISIVGAFGTLAAIRLAKSQQTSAS